MKICLSHSTALTWLSYRPNVRDVRYRARDVELAGFRLPPPDMLSALRDHLAASTECDPAELASLELLVGDAARRRVVSGASVHVCSHGLPAGAIIRIPCSFDGIDLYTCSPELTFLQLAGERGDLVAGIETGLALCSSYRVDRSRRAGVARREAPDAPLTSARRINAFLDRVPGTRGVDAARRSLAYVRDGSRSPRESHLAMIYGLPIRLGGFGLGMPQLNPGVRTAVRRDAYGDARAQDRYPDLRFEHADSRGRTRIALLDYDGDAEHGRGGRKAGRDAARRNELEFLDVDACFSMTSTQAGDFNEVCIMAESLRRALGCRKQPRITGDANEPVNRRKIEEARRRQFALWSRLIGIPNAKRAGRVEG